MLLKQGFSYVLCISQKCLTVSRGRLCSTALANNIYSDKDSFQQQCDTESKLLKVAVIGTPNAGKSTFINNLLDRKVCATSSKAHTTRGKSMAIFTSNDTQVVFVDTPGLINDKEQKRFNLEKSFVRDAKTSLKEADIVGVIHDVTNVWTREKLDIKIINLLEFFKHKPSFLVLNKIDVLKSKRKLLDIIRIITENCLDGKPVSVSMPKNTKSEFKGWPYFQDIFMVSALTGDGLAEVKNYLIKNAKPSKWMFPENVWTDQSAEDVIVKSVQAKLLDFLPQEIPYSLDTKIEYFDVRDDGVISTVVIVECPNSRIAKLIAGTSDGKLRQIMESVQQDLQEAFQNYVKIRIVLNPPYKE